MTQDQGPMLISGVTSGSGPVHEMSPTEEMEEEGEGHHNMTGPGDDEKQPTSQSVHGLPMAITAITAVTALQ